MEHDKSFVEALKYGMPPVCGFGVSERLFGFLVDKPLRETVIFPLMKPESKIRFSNYKMGNLPITREKAIEILMSMPNEKAEMNHYLESEAIMRGVARKFGENEEYWGMLGLLHDIDWGLTKKESKNICQ